MTTERQREKQRERGMREVLISQYRQKMAKLNEELAQVRAAGRARAAEQRRRCGQETREVAEQARRDARSQARTCCQGCRANAKNKAREVIAEKRGGCRVEHVGIIQKTRTEAQVLKDKAAAERDFRAEMQGIGRANRERGKDRPKASAAERLSEAIEALELEIETQAPELSPYWRKLPKATKAAATRDKGRTGRASPYEAFVERAQADRANVAAALDAAGGSDADFAREQAEHYRGRGGRGKHLPEAPF